MSDKVNYAATVSTIALAVVSIMSIVVACSKQNPTNASPNIELATTIAETPLRFEDLYEGDKFYYNKLTFIKLRPVYLAGDDSYPVNAFCPSTSYYVTFGNREEISFLVE